MITDLIAMLAGAAAAGACFGAGALYARRSEGDRLGDVYEHGKFIGRLIQARADRPVADSERAS